MIDFYWSPQSRAFRVLWLLEELGVAYRRIEVDIHAGAQHRREFLLINPMGKVPALVDGVQHIAESGAIVAYLADTYAAAALAPQPDAPTRGRYLQWLFFASSCIEGAYAELAGKAQLAEMTAGWGSADKVLAVLEQALENGPWILGERFSAADVLIATDLSLLTRSMGLVKSRPAFERYLARAQSRPAFARAVALDRSPA